MPILLGRKAVIRERMRELHINELYINKDQIVIVDPASVPDGAGYAAELYELRQRKGVTRREADEMALDHTVFGSLMLRRGAADALIGGLTQHYPDVIRPRPSGNFPCRLQLDTGLRGVCADHAAGPHLLPGGHHGKRETLQAEDVAEK